MVPDQTSMRALFVALSLFVAAGCKPKIGDECSVSTDCSSTGDRLCDTTQPSGYCTIFNCEPGSCPGEAICVAFDNSTSKACEDPQSADRFQRTFCMRRCDGNGDCRTGYTCADLNADENPWGATVVEFGDVNGKVCVPLATKDMPAENANTEMCSVTDAGFDVVPWVPDGGTTTTDAGSDAADGAADGGVDGGTDASDASTDT